MDILDDKQIWLDPLTMFLILPPLYFRSCVCEVRNGYGVEFVPLFLLRVMGRAVTTIHCLRFARMKYAATLTCRVPLSQSALCSPLGVLCSALLCCTVLGVAFGCGPFFRARMEAA